MLFVGRVQEIKTIIGAIRQNKHVILTGKFGIGRTALINHIIATQKQWRFVMLDFERAPAQAVRSLLFKPGATKNEMRNSSSHKPARLMSDRLEIEGKPWVIVLDNIARLSAQKLAFIRRLNGEGRFHFIAIVEAFLPEKELFLLRKELIPARIITLQHLSLKTGEQWFRNFAVKYRLNWPDNQIKMWASATQGYPLGIKEIMGKELEHLGKK
jgi:hypothetical protein